MMGNRPWIVTVAVLSLAVVLLARALLSQQKAPQQTVQQVESLYSIEGEVVKTNIISTYDQTYFQMSVRLMQAKRSDPDYWNHSLIRDAETAVELATIYLKNEYTGTGEFDRKCRVEHDEENQIWAVTFKLKDWPHIEATIIIDETDGTELFASMPNGM